MSETVERRNPLAYEKISRLLIRFAIPSIVGSLVIAFYNIVDQLFIGNVIGTLGNTATGLFFPFVNACLALGLGFGVGGAAAFNLKMGAGEKEEAPYFFGNALTSLFLSGVLLCIVAQIFMPVILPLFGASVNVMEMATEYATILAFGFPLSIIGSGSGNLLRADGRPHLTMVCNLTGCLLNIG
ncbi:MAG: MATE family efflux transporter, partial [Lachnospiraceae bacterium]|nr:MATE family efflux transporter [Lachnospiraceae bacterium]